MVTYCIMYGRESFGFRRMVTELTGSFWFNWKKGLKVFIKQHTMRKFYLFAIQCTVAMAFNLQAYAQDPTVQQREEVNTLLSEFQAKLGITKNQKDQLAPLMIKQKVLIGKLCELKPTDEKWLEANKEVQALQTQIDGILTDEQRNARQEWIKSKVKNNNVEL